MRKLYSYVLGFLWAGLLQPGSIALANADPTPAAQVTVIESSDQAIVLAMTVPDFQVETVYQGGEPFQRILIAGLEQTTTPGAPQTPSRGALVGVPTTASLVVQVLATEQETFSGYKLSPAPQLTIGNNDLDHFASGTVQTTFFLDSDHYATDAFYPAAPVQLGYTGYLRDQAVVQLYFYPVQYNPVRGEIRLYRRLVVQLTWESTIQVASSGGGVSPFYEDLLRHSLVNYGGLNRPGVQPDAPTARASGQVTPAESTSAPALKLGIAADGLYKLTYTDLLNVGFNPSTVDPRTIKVQQRGSELLIYVHGEQDGVFDPTDYLLFYGVAYQDRYTAHNVYWLSAGGAAGRRLAQQDVAPAENAPVAQRFLTTHHREEDTVYWQTMPGRGEDRWFWDKRLSPNTRDIAVSRAYPVDLRHLVAGETASLRVRLKGYTGLGHRTQIIVNNRVIDDQRWHGQGSFTHTASFPQSLLKEGENVVLVKTVDIGVTPDQILVNWLEVDAWHTYVAENDRLWLGTATAGVQQFAIRGLTQSNVLVWEVTDPSNPVQLLNAAVSSEGRTYTVKFTADARLDSRYLVMTADQVQPPATLVLDQPSAWQTPDQGADYIIITADEFYPNAQVLADHRQAGGLRVATVKISDIYDEFNAGIFHPQAIRDFLHYAYENWQAPAPTYVLLLGDANQDYKDNLRNGTRNYVPTQVIDSSHFGEVSSDQWFVAVSGNDPLPDLLIGRLVAQSSQEASDIIAKIMRYEQTPPDAAWNQQVLLVADDDESKFKEISEQLTARLPYYYTVQRVDVEHYPPGDPKVEILQYLNNGSILVNYSGHGEYFGWGQWDQNQKAILTIADVEQLTNAHRLPVITVANCLNGFFAGPQDKPALAEILQRRPNGGAVAIWAPTGLAHPTGHRILLDQFYAAIFVNDQHYLGAATTAAALATWAQSEFWGELIATYVLFGDPATKLGIPPNYPYLRQTAPVQGADGVLLDQPLQVSFNKPMTEAILTLGSTPAGITFIPTWNADFTTVTFAPSGFTHRTRYELFLSGQDRLGNSLGPGLVPNPWTFTTTADDAPPTGTIVVQSGALTATLTTAVLQVVFAEPVRPASVTYAITPFVRSSLVWEADQQHAWLQHERFQEGERYTLTVLAAKDLAGNALRAPLQHSFVVGTTNYTHLPVIARRP